MDKLLVLKPRISEKAYDLSQTRQTYVFTVPLDVSKQAVARAVEAQFDVSVETVNTARIKGKTKRTIVKGRRPIVGKQSNFKKAYVRLKEGDSIAVFPAEDDKKTAKKGEKA